MKRIMLSCVGNRDPIAEDTNEEGAILTLVRKVRPEVVVLFPTKDHPENKWEGTGEKAAWTKELLETQEFRDLGVKCCEVLELVLEDPTVHKEVLKALRSRIADTLKMFASPGEELEIHVNVSSGTPQMHASWLVLANSGYIPNARLYQVSSPRFGKKSIDERVSEIEHSFVREDMLIERAKRDMSIGAFEAAAKDMEEIARITSYMERSQLYSIFSDLARAYSYWDRLDYTKARDKLNKIAGQAARFIELKKLSPFLERQAKVVSELSSANEETFLLLTDIYHNAYRRFHRGEYADVVARSWRLVEGIYYWRLITLGVNPREPGMSSNPEIIAFMRERSLRMDRPILFYNSEVILRQFDKAWLEQFLSKQLESPELPVEIGASTVRLQMPQIHDMRNKSVAGHGTRSISPEQAAKALALAVTCLGFAFKEKRDEIDKYPFSLQVICNNVIGELR